MTTPIDLNATFEDLLAIKRANIAAIDSNLDMRETSPLYNGTVVNSIEQVQMLAVMQYMTDLLFADTAPREYLIRRMAERGLKPYEASRAKLKALFNNDVPIGSRYSLGQLNYEVIERITAGEFIVECETSGSEGNLYFGQIIPIEYIDGLQTAEITELLVPGEEEEDVEAMRKRYFNSFESVAFGGNRADYKEKTIKQAGVGGVRVYRAWNGGGTTKLVIINSLYQKPTQTLVDDVQEACDPLHAQGEGLGYAPMDHIVTVFAVGETIINLTLNLTLQTGWTWPDVEEGVNKAIDTYFTELSKDWAEGVDDNAGLVVRASQIEYRLLNVTGILDIANTQLNGTTANVQLPPENVPKRGVVNG